MSLMFPQKKKSIIKIEKTTYTNSMTISTCKYRHIYIYIYSHVSKSGPRLLLRRHRSLGRLPLLPRRRQRRSGAAAGAAATRRELHRWSCRENHGKTVGKCWFHLETYVDFVDFHGKMLELRWFMRFRYCEVSEDHFGELFVEVDNFHGVHLVANNGDLNWKRRGDIMGIYWGYVNLIGIYGNLIG